MNEKQEGLLKEIHDLADDIISKYGGGSIFLNGNGVFVNCNQYSIDPFTILQKLHNLSNALVKIQHYADIIKQTDK